MLATSLPSRAAGAAPLLRSKARCYPLLCQPLSRRRGTEDSFEERTRRFTRLASSSIAAAATAANDDDQQQQQKRRDPDLLRALLAEAVSSEDYREASRLKQELETADPSILLQLRLEEAVKEERYADAAELKAQLEALRPPPPPKFEPGPTTSDTVTNGIRVKVKSFFVASQSVAGSTFTFAYRIKISNETGSGRDGGNGGGGGGGGSSDSGGKTFQLLSRTWEIVDGGDGTKAIPPRTERVRGPGVVGETPVLAPGESFSYSSFAQLRTPAGSMRGTYTFVEVERNEEEGEEEEEGGEEEEGKGSGSAASSSSSEKKAPPPPLPRPRQRQQQQQRRTRTRNPLVRAIGPEFDVVIGQFGLDERDSSPPEPGTM